MQRNGLIKALPFHKHLPVRKVCEHQVQRSHTFCRDFVWTILYGQEDDDRANYGHFLSVKAR